MKSGGFLFGGNIAVAYLCVQLPRTLKGGESCFYYYKGKNHVQQNPSRSVQYTIIQQDTVKGKK